MDGLRIRRQHAGSRRIGGSPRAPARSPLRPPPAAREPPVPRRDVFAITEFRALWSAQALSSAGDQLSQVTIGFAVYARTGSPFLAALAYALTYLPSVVGGPALAGLADAFPRQQLMITLDLARAGLVALMALPGMPIPGLATLFFGTVLLGIPFTAARAALLTDVLPRPCGRPAGHRQPDRPAGPDRWAAGRRRPGGRARPVPGARPGLAVVQPVGRHPGLLGAAPARPAAQLPGPPSREITRAGAATIFGTPALRVLVLFGWLAGFTVVPEGLAVPYARTLGGGPPPSACCWPPARRDADRGVRARRLTRPSDRLRPMGWLAMLSCAPLLFCQVRPPLPVVAALWALAGAGGAYQLAAAAAFVRALPRAQRLRAFAVAQSGLLAAQVLGILAAGAVAQRLGPPAAVALAGLLGLIAAAVLATDWIRRHAELLDLLDAQYHQLSNAHLSQPAARPAGRPAPPDGDRRPGQPQPARRSHSKTSRRRQRHPAGRLAPRPRSAARPQARPPGARVTCPGEARLAAARLLDQILGDRRAFPLFRDDDPPGQVDQRAHAECDHRNSQEDEPDQGGIDAGVLGDPGADAGHQPAVPGPD